MRHTTLLCCSTCALFYLLLCSSGLYKYIDYLIIGVEKEVIGPWFPKTNKPIIREEPRTLTTAADLDVQNLERHETCRNSKGAHAHTHTYSIGRQGLVRVM